MNTNMIGTAKWLELSKAWNLSAYLPVALTRGILQIMPISSRRSASTVQAIAFRPLELTESESAELQRDP